MNKWLHRLVAVSAVSAISLLGPSASAFAVDADDLSSPSSDTYVSAEVDRVIDKSAEHYSGTTVGARLFGATSSSLTTSPALPIPADEQPDVGETVLVRYADATVVHEAVTLACVVTTSADTPYKNLNTAHAGASFTQTGCTGITRAESRLQMYFGFQWTNKSSGGVDNPRSGVRYGWGQAWACTNTNTSPFRMMVANAVGSTQLYGIAYSNEVNLSCGA